MAGPDLAGAYGSGGAGEALERLLARKFAEAELAERQRANMAGEQLGRDTLTQRKGEATALDARATAERAEAARAFAARLGFDRDKFGEDKRQFNEKLGEDRHQFDTGLGFKQGEAVRESEEAEKNRKTQRDIAGIYASRSGQGGTGPTKLVRGKDAQGRPVSHLIDRAGKILETFEAPTSSADARAADDAEVSAQAVQGIRERFKETYVGPLNGRILRVKLATGVKLSPEEAAFASAVAHMKNEIIRDITGAAVGVQEEGRIMGEIPDLEQPAQAFLANLEQTEKNRQFLREQKAKRAGRTAPAAGPTDSGEAPMRFDFDPKTGALAPRKP